MDLNIYYNNKVLSAQEREGFRIISEKNNDMNIEKAERIIASIYKDFGEPIKKEVERSQFIDNISTTMKWETYDYTMELYYNNLLAKA